MARSKKKTPSRRKNTAKRKPQTKRSFIRFSTLFKLLFTFAVLAAVVLMYLDAHIRQQFEGKRWALPAKVYARPLELYAGAELSMHDLKIELQGLGYQFTQSASGPGQAAFSSSKAIIATRGFKFTDGSEPAQRLILSFDNSGLSQMTDYHGKALSLVRLEPVLIGGIYPLNNEDRDLIQLKDTPVALTQALIAIEDKDFYQHAGISWRGIARAMWVNLKAGSFVQGGSTLTQQLIKNFYLTSDRSLLRKLMEVPMALLLERHYSKDEILEAYLNEVYLGQDGARAIHGFGLGAHYFFAQPLQELSLPQLAMLAGLVKGPSYYDPRRHPERAKQRRDLVLKVLLAQGKITQPQYQKAVNSGLGIVKKGTLLKEAYPAYLDLVKRQLRNNYRDEDLSSEGLRVFTSLDPIVQNQAEQALVSTINQLNNRYGKQLDKLQGSMVVTEPQTGEVLAVIGDKNTRYKGFNRALDTLRPIGSLVKPAVYLTALQQGYTLSSPLDDSAFSLTQKNGQIWRPQNFDHQSHGTVPLITALSHSYNQSTARLGMDVGLTHVIDTLKKLGIQRHLDAYPSLLLGAQGLTPIEVASMYQTIAANGFQMPPRAIRTVTDSQGNTLSSYPFQLQQTVSTQQMYLLQQALIDVTHQGTGRSIYQQLPAAITVAGKTGTSDDQRDSWFAGFSGNRLAVVWLGLDNNDPLPVTGSSGALKVWTHFMHRQQLTSFQPVTPEDIDLVWVDRLNGKLSAANCENARQLPFIRGTAPTETSDCINIQGNSADPITKSIDWIKDWFN